MGPKAMSKGDIEAFKADWCNAVSRAIAVGFDVKSHSRFPA